MIIPFNSPVSDATAAGFIEEFSPTSEGSVLDAGCGRGEFLIRVIERHGCRGLGIDCDSAVLDDARNEARVRIPGERAVFRKGSLAGAGGLPPAILDGDGPFNLAICLGASHAFAPGEGAFQRTLEVFHRTLVSGGEAFIGEGYWKRDPDPEYRSFLGDPVGIYRSHFENLEFARRMGFEKVEAAVSSREEWDAFEIAHQKRIIKAAAARPEDEELRKKAAFAPIWWDAYEKWGRSTMGFGLYHLKRSDAGG